MSSERAPIVPSAVGSEARPGPLHGLRVVELASDRAAHGGKLLADLGAEVILVEPPGGHVTRTYGPFAGDIADPNRSLWFWQHNTSKLGVTLDLARPADASVFRHLVAKADIVLEAEVPGRLHALGLDHSVLRDADPTLIWVSVTPFGRNSTRAHEPATDLTLMGGGGMAWSCGYDDHALPPVRGLNDQAMHISSIWAVVGALAAVEARSANGRGQHVDVSMHAAVNVNTEQATHTWLVAERNVVRQTGRHAGVVPTDAIVAPDRDGHEVHTGFPPRSEKQLRALLGWLRELGLADEFPMTSLIEIAADAGGIELAKLLDDEFTQECYRAGRDAMVFLASRLRGYDFFIGGQERALPVGVISSPEEAIADPHIVARGFPTAVHHPALGRDVVYPGAPIRFTASPWRIARPAPLVGEHQATLPTPDV